MSYKLYLENAYTYLNFTNSIVSTTGCSSGVLYIVLQYSKKIRAPLLQLLCVRCENDCFLLGEEATTLTSSQHYGSY